MILDTTTRKLQIQLTTAQTTNAMPVIVDYVDMTTTATTGGTSPSNTNGVTAVDILAAPAASTQRKVNSISVHNSDTATKIVTVLLNDNGTTYHIVDVTLNVDDMLGYTDGKGWYTLDLSGNIKTVVGTSASAISDAIHASTSKATPVDADEFGIWDSVSGALRKVTFANLKTTLASTFAALAGSASQVLSVAAATAAAHAVRADQIQGQSLTAYTTGGSSTAYTLTPSPAITAYTAKQRFNVTFHTASGASPTLSISGVATPPNLVKQNIDGSYTNIGLAEYPANWNSDVILLSATQALVVKLPEYIAANYTPTVSSSVGTITSHTVVYGRYTRWARLWCVEVQLSIDNAGTGAGNLLISSPVTPTQNQIGCGTRTNSQSVLSVFCGGANIQVASYDGTTCIATGATPAVNLTGAFL